MQIIPAIDLLNGKVVRLTQGDYNQVEVYSENPVEVAGLWREKGAEYLHCVDLDGARAGQPVNLHAVKDIIDSVDIQVEFGGGLRDIAAIEGVLSIGVTKVVLGTAVLKDKDFAETCISVFNDKVVFSVDVRNNTVAVDGWTKDSSSPLYETIEFFRSIGLQRLIYTDILRDGMMEGPNIEGLKNILGISGMEVIAAGGISQLDHIMQLKELEPLGLKGVIIGKALYEESIDLEEAIRVS